MRNRNSQLRITYEAAPDWLERNALVRSGLWHVPTLLMLNIPGEEGWYVATRLESNVIADPSSLVGRFLRPHSGLLGLRYVSTN